MCCSPNRMFQRYFEVWIVTRLEDNKPGWIIKNRRGFLDSCHYFLVAFILFLYSASSSITSIIFTPSSSLIVCILIIHYLSLIITLRLVIFLKLARLTNVFIIFTFLNFLLIFLIFISNWVVVVVICASILIIILI